MLSPYNDGKMQSGVLETSPLERFNAVVVLGCVWSCVCRDKRSIRPLAVGFSYDPCSYNTSSSVRLKAASVVFLPWTRNGKCYLWIFQVHLTLVLFFWRLAREGRRLYCNSQ